MSSMYPPYDDASARRCQRCGRPLAPSEVYCGTCGEYNFLTSTNGATERAQPPGAPWNGPAPQTFYGGGQPAAPPGPNTFLGGNFVPLPPSQQPVYSSNPYGTPQQPLYSTLAPPPMVGFQQSDMHGYQNGYHPVGLHQPPARKSGPKIGWIVGIILLIIILVGGGAGYFYVASHLEKTTANVPSTSSPTPTIPPLFSDSFQNNNNGWDLTSISGKYSVKVGGGSMVLEDDDNKLLWELIPGTKVYSDFKLVVDATLSQGDQSNGYGVFIRGSSNQNNELATYYRFELYGDGTYTVFKGVLNATGNSQSNTLVDYTMDPAIQKQGSVNHIAIIANGPDMTFIVNGQTLKVVTDTSYTGGSVALFVSNLPAPTPPGAQATFNNLAIYPVR
jgi:hypothetical protein